jgi:adenylosuccinate synthase
MSDIVIGLQYGAEGKGKVIKCLLDSNNYALSVRFNGGPNAGHTIYKNGRKIILHQLPIGILYDNMSCLIGPNCVVDMDKLEKELDMVEDFIKPNTIKNKLYLSYNAHVILPKHIDEDEKTDKIGSTKCGIRPTYRDKYDRCGTRIEKIPILDNRNRWRVVDPYEIIRKCVINKEQILFEGAQGFQIDINWGYYPYVTSSHCDSGMVTSSGYPMSKIAKIYGIAKIYSTYVGAMKFQPDGDELLEKIQILGNEYGSTTERIRQCKWLNLDDLNKAIFINGVTDLIINKCDIITQLNHFKLYHKTSELTFNTWNEMKNYIKLNIPTNINIIFSYSKDNI